MERIDPYIRKARYDVLKTPLMIEERVIFDYELLYIKEGRPLITIGNTLYHAERGEIYLFRPGQRHSLCLKEEGIFIQPHVHFDLVQYEDRREVTVNFRPMDALDEAERKMIRPDLMEEMFPGLPSRLKLTNMQYMEFLLFDLIQSFSGHSPYRELEMKWRFMRVLNQLLEEVGYRYDNRQKEQDKVASRIGSFLEHNLYRNVSLEEIERLYHMNRSYLGRLFRQRYGTSIIRYHQMLRVNRSKELLMYTNATVTEIAEEMGFPNVNDFSRTFKRVAGMSPNNFRQNTLSDVAKSDF